MIGNFNTCSLDLPNKATVQADGVAPITTTEWQHASGKRSRAGLVFPNGSGKPWRETDWRNWRKCVYQPAASASGVGGLRPYDLRHSFCSLLIYEGASVVEVARQLGHSPTMTLDTYGHVFEEFEGSERVSAEEQIRRARNKLVSVFCPPASPKKPGPKKTPANRKADARIRTGDPFITRSLLPLRVLAAERDFRLLALNPQ